MSVTNQLRAHLLIVLPGAVGPFSRLDSAISLASLNRFASQDRADWLSEKRLAAWLQGRRVLRTHQPGRVCTGGWRPLHPARPATPVQLALLVSTSPHVPIRLYSANRTRSLSRRSAS